MRERRDAEVKVGNNESDYIKYALSEAQAAAS
jgi:hypothetical protein